MSTKAITLREFVNRVQDDARIFLMQYERAIARHPEMFKGSAPRSYWLRIFYQYMRGDNSIEQAGE